MSSFVRICARAITIIMIMMLFRTIKEKPIIIWFSLKLVSSSVVVVVIILVTKLFYFLLLQAVLVPRLRYLEKKSSLWFKKLELYCCVRGQREKTWIDFAFYFIDMKIQKLRHARRVPVTSWFRLTHVFLQYKQHLNHTNKVYRRYYQSCLEKGKTFESKTFETYD